MKSVEWDGTQWIDTPDNYIINTWAYTQTWVSSAKSTGKVEFDIKRNNFPRAFRTWALGKGASHWSLQA